MPPEISKNKPYKVVVIDPTTGNPVIIGGGSGGLIFKGAIAVASDFPTAADVQTGWLYTITADVTDNDPTKTNTGLSFKTGDEIAWDGSTWIVVGQGNVVDLQRAYDNGNEILTSGLGVIIRDNGTPISNTVTPFGQIIDTNNAAPLTLLSDTVTLAIPYEFTLEQVQSDFTVNFAVGLPDRIETNVNQSGTDLSIPGFSTNAMLGAVIVKDGANAGSYLVVGVENGALTNSRLIVIDASTGLPPTFSTGSATAKTVNITSFIGAGYGQQGRYLVGHKNSGSGYGGANELDLISNEAGDYDQLQKLENKGDLSSCLQKLSNNPDVGLGYSADVPLRIFEQLANHGDFKMTSMASDPTGLGGTDNATVWYNANEDVLKVWNFGKGRNDVYSPTRDMQTMGWEIDSVTSYNATTPIALDLTKAIHIVQGSGGAVTSTATPSIDKTGLEYGDIVILTGGGSTPGDVASALTLQDDRVLSGSDIFLSQGKEVTIACGEYIAFMYLNFTSGGEFTEVFRSPGLVLKESWSVATDYNNNQGNFRNRSIASNGGYRFTFKIPDDAREIVSVDLVGFPDSTFTGQDIDLDTDYGAIGEPYNQHSNSDTTSVYSMTANQLSEIDLLPVLPNVDAGDYCGVFVDHNGIGSAVHYIGVKILYK